MRAFEFSRCAFGISVAVALLSACGGGSSVPVEAGSAFVGRNRPQAPSDILLHRQQNKPSSSLLASRDLP